MTRIHTNHPARVWDRTCPACLSRTIEDVIYESSELFPSPFVSPRTPTHVLEWGPAEVRVGDYVILKSGGPLMRVAANVDGHSVCTWNGPGGLEAAAFLAECLVRSVPLKAPAAAQNL